VLLMVLLFSEMQICAPPRQLLSGGYCYFLVGIQEGLREFLRFMSLSVPSMVCHVKSP